MNTTTESSDPQGYLREREGIWSWLFTTNHRRIAILYLIAITFFFVLGAATTGLLRIEALRPEGEFLLPEDFDRLFTLHGLFLVFFFLLPSLTGVLGNSLLPGRIGARNLAFPRLNLATWYLFVTGGLLLMWSTIHGAVDAGWSLSLPYSAHFSSAELTPAILGVLLAGISSGLMGLNLVVTVHRRRGPGMTWSKVPVFVWGQYANGLVLALVTPLLVAAMVLLLRSELGLAPLRASASGDALLFKQLFWAYAHPAIHAPLLAGIGITTRLLTVCSDGVLYDRRRVVFAIFAVALFGTLSSGQHVLPEASGFYRDTLAPLFALLVAVPCAVIICHWVATLHCGSLRFTAPMLYAYAFIGLFTIGGASGLFLAAGPLGVHLQGTTFVVAHLHYFIVGGVITAFLGGLHHWWPMITGRSYPENLARAVAVTIFLGFNTMFLPQFVLGYLGKPSRTHTYPEQFQVLEVLSSAGATVLVAGLILPALYLTWSFFWGPRATGAHHAAHSGEWSGPSAKPDTNTGGLG
jgi:cytochrome c oxidase subunit I